jgi:hypothetical protein
MGRAIGKIKEYSFGIISSFFSLFFTKKRVFSTLATYEIENKGKIKGTEDDIKIFGRMSSLLNKGIL